MREHSGLSGAEVRKLLAHLELQGLLDTREVADPIQTPPPRHRLAWLASPFNALMRRAS